MTPLLKNSSVPDEFLPGHSLSEIILGEDVDVDRVRTALVKNVASAIGDTPTSADVELAEQVVREEPALRDVVLGWHLFPEGEARAVVCANLRRTMYLALQLAKTERDLVLAQRDNLTGALLRTAGFAVLEGFIQHHLEYQTENPPIVIFMDIDYFGNFNNTHGHLAGDEVLREVVRRCQHVLENAHNHFVIRTMRNSAHAASTSGEKPLNHHRRFDDQSVSPREVVRYGGEEFMFPLEGLTYEQGLILAEAMRSVIADEPIFINESLSVNVTASFGVAQFSSKNDQKEGNIGPNLVARADICLYGAKTENPGKINGHLSAFGTSLDVPPDMSQDSGRNRIVGWGPDNKVQVLSRPVTLPAQDSSAVA